MEADTSIPVTLSQVFVYIYTLILTSFLPQQLFKYIGLIIFTFFISWLEADINKLKSNINSDNESEYSNLSKKISNNAEKYILSINFIKIFFAVFLSMYIAYNQIYFEYINESIIHHVLFIFIALSISFWSIISGSSLPKKLNLINTKPVSRFNLNIILIIYAISLPIITIIDFLNSFVLKILHKDEDDFDEKVSAEEIKALVESASEKGVFNDIEKEMINSVISFDNITAKDIMVSRKDTYKIDINEDLNNYIDEMIETYYSRIPVYRDNIDDIIGILNTKDLLRQARKVGFDNIKIEDLLQKPYFVPEMKSIDELFKEMQRLRNHMAILVDEYGGFSGIVTIEDLIEQIMGDINDEYDDEELNISKLSDNIYIIDGTTEIREINKELDLNLENENYDTISGLLVEKLGYIPNEGEKPSIEINNLVFKVEHASENRIQKIKLKINPIAEYPDNAEL